MTVIDSIAVPEPGDVCTLVEFGDGDGVADRVHLLCSREIYAINAAIAAGRPLLVRGEPGIGKSQLARAAARALGRAFIKHVVDSQTEPRDLLWSFDAVKRLAEAQLAGALRSDLGQVRAELAVEKFLHPGPLWWAFNWEDASLQCETAKGMAPSLPDHGDWRQGCVLLLDEIDKAESEVPNGLLEIMGAREFTPLGRSEPVRAQSRPPLVVITTNEERALPDPFLRRCLVLHLGLPSDTRELKGYLIERGRLHFPTMSEAVLAKAADLLVEDRQAAIGKQVRPWPGQAEYLDLLRAVGDMARDDPGRQDELLGIVREYTLQKHVGCDPSE